MHKVFNKLRENLILMGSTDNGEERHKEKFINEYPENPRYYLLHSDVAVDNH